MSKERIEKEELKQRLSEKAIGGSKPSVTYSITYNVHVAYKKFSKVLLERLMEIDEVNKEVE